MKIQGNNLAILAALARARSEASRSPTPASTGFTLGPSTPVAKEQPASGLARLVAGTVRSGINRGEGFDQIPARPLPRPTLQLYSNSAERVEAATRVAAGRILDTTA